MAEATPQPSTPKNTAATPPQPQEDKITEPQTEQAIARQFRRDTSNKRQAATQLENTEQTSPQTNPASPQLTDLLTRQGQASAQQQANRQARQRLSQQAQQQAQATLDDPTASEFEKTRAAGQASGQDVTTSGGQTAAEAMAEQQRTNEQRAAEMKALRDASLKQLGGPTTSPVQSNQERIKQAKKQALAFRQGKASRRLAKRLPGPAKLLTSTGGKADKEGSPETEQAEKAIKLALKAAAAFAWWIISSIIMSCISCLFFIFLPLIIIIIIIAIVAAAAS